MKTMILFQLIVMLMLCLAPLHLPQPPPPTHYYQLDPAFTDQELFTIREGIKHFDDNIPCFVLKDASTIPRSRIINDFVILDIHPVEKTEDKTVGFYRTTTHSIFLSRTMLFVDLKRDQELHLPIQADYQFKILLHELAHAFGMKGDPHPMNDYTKSHLSSKISRYTPKFLYKNDVQYLRNLFCNSTPFPLFK